MTPGSATVTPTSLTFPARPAGSISIPQTVTLSNTGSGAFALASTGITGANASEFSTTTTCGSSLAAGGSCTLNISFAPTTAGTKSATLVINGDTAAGLPISIPLAGSAQ